jgi:hypothetical protein
VPAGTRCLWRNIRSCGPTTVRQTGRDWHRSFDQHPFTC